MRKLSPRLRDTQASVAHPDPLGQSLQKHHQTMPVEFIDNDSLLDKAVRKRIRRQAALGKNKGRTVHRKSRLASTATQIQGPKPVNVLRPPALAGIGDIERPIDDGLFFPAFQHGGPRVLIKKGTLNFLAQILSEL